MRTLSLNEGNKLELLLNYMLFLVKTLTIVAGVVLVLLGFVRLLSQARHNDQQDGEIEISSVSELLDDYKDALLHTTLSPEDYKKHIKAEKKKEKDQKKLAKHEESEEEAISPRLFVLTFEGDMEASEVEGLRECISALLNSIEPHDEVLLILESAGGYMHHYGLAASQLARLRTNNIHLTIAVDTIAASGGYLMACVANEIIAAPFAIIGSIGVVAEIPNFHKLLKKHDIDYELHTAGQFKRTLTLFGENTDKVRRKFIEELEDAHYLFKKHILEYRDCDIEKIATGEHWQGDQAIELGLIDRIETSDDFILNFHKKHPGNVFKIEYTVPESWIDKFQGRFFGLLSASLSKAYTQLLKTQYPKT